MSRSGVVRPHSAMRSVPARCTGHRVACAPCLVEKESAGRSHLEQSPSRFRQERKRRSCLGAQLSLVAQMALPLRSHTPRAAVLKVFVGVLAATAHPASGTGISIPVTATPAAHVLLSRIVPDVTRRDFTADSPKDHTPDTGTAVRASFTADDRDIAPHQHAAPDLIVSSLRRRSLALSQHHQWPAACGVTAKRATRSSPRWCQSGRSVPIAAIVLATKPMKLRHA